jgi:hypothetical protein
LLEEPFAVTFESYFWALLQVKKSVYGKEPHLFLLVLVNLLRMLRQNCHNSFEYGIEEVALRHFSWRYWVSSGYIVLFGEVQLHLQFFELKLCPHNLQALSNGLIVLAQLFVKKEGGFNLVVFSDDLQTFFDREEIGLASSTFYHRFDRRKDTFWSDLATQLQTKLNKLHVLLGLLRYRRGWITHTMRANDILDLLLILFKECLKVKKLLIDVLS